MKECYEVWDVLVSLDSETLLRVITDYHGMQILTKKGFIDHLVDKGLMIDEYAYDDDDEEDEEPEGPGDDDYVISGCGPLGSQIIVSTQSKWADRRISKIFDTEEEAVEAIRKDMAEQSFWSNVWRQDDHGGIALYDMR
jgi:hypothetical protein